MTDRLRSLSSCGVRTENDLTESHLSGLYLEKRSVTMGATRNFLNENNLSIAASIKSIRAGKLAINPANLTLARHVMGHPFRGSNGEKPFFISPELG